MVLTFEKVWMVKAIPRQIPTTRKKIPPTKFPISPSPLGELNSVWANTNTLPYHYS